jgi:carbamoyl-phosphate synthase large subunit
VPAVLFTCAGQRVDIVTAFTRAGATTVAADADPLAPALYHADRYAIVPLVADDGYLDAVRNLVRAHTIDLIVPLNDLDHVPLASARDELDATVLLPDAEVVERMSDKYRAHRFFQERGIASPQTWLPDAMPAEPPFPVLVKARRGFGSRNIYRAADRAELDFFLAHTPVESIVQAACSGKEFSIDVLCDLDGRCLNAIPRTMIESKGGESIKGQTVKDWDLIEYARRVAEALPVKGPATIQCFREADGSHQVTDVNPRFGGGFPLPLAAGSRYPELALALAAGERPSPRLGEFREGVTMTRFFSHLCLTTAADGALEPFSEELPEPLVQEP